MVGKARKNNEILEKLSRTAPHYNRNRPHLCSFWIKGECTRGDACPFRHEMPSEVDSNVSQKIIRDRYYGVNDVLAKKILEAANKLPKLESPKDQTITTLCLSGINSYINETDLYNHFFQYGQVIKAYIPPTKNELAFITFASRKEAELAANANFGKLVINDQKLKLMWAKTPQPTSKLKNNDEMQLNDITITQSDHDFPHPNLITNPNLVVQDNSQNTLYPSENTNQLGSQKTTK